MPAPVAKLVANIVNREFIHEKKLIGEVYQQAQVAAKFEKFPVPSNLTELTSCKANDCVYKAMTPSAKRLNGELHYVEAAVCRSLTAQALVFGKLMNLK